MLAVDSAERVIHYSVGSPGSYHDARVFRISKLEDLLSTVPPCWHLLGIKFSVPFTIRVNRCLWDIFSLFLLSQVKQLLTLVGLRPRISATRHNFVNYMFNEITTRVISIAIISVVKSKYYNFVYFR